MIYCLRSLAENVRETHIDVNSAQNVFHVREVSVALQSVFQPSELTRYVTLPKREKEEQLMELMCIVAGIRLFNRDCQRGGEGIDDRKSE